LAPRRSCQLEALVAERAATAAATREVEVGAST
jgi:hypothetical protein